MAKSQASVFEPTRRFRSWGLFWEIGQRPQDWKQLRPQAHCSMARQVRGYEGTLLEAIEAGVVPRPERLRYREWLAWRAAEGQRPSRRRGDAAGTTTNGEEAELWRDVMRTLHGAEESEPEEISDTSLSQLGGCSGK